MAPSLYFLQLNLAQTTRHQETSTTCQGHLSTVTKGTAQPFVYSPEGKDNEAADEKYGREDEKQGVTCLLPSGIRKHLSRLKTKKKKSNHIQIK